MTAAGDAICRALLESDRCGFFSEEQLAALAAVEPGRLVLIRWHEDRERCAAGAVDMRLRVVERDAGWGLRDVSLLSTDPVCIEAEQAHQDRVALEERNAREHADEMLQRDS